MSARRITAALLAVAVSACADSSSLPTGAQIPDSPAFGVTVTQTHANLGIVFEDNDCLPEGLLFTGKVHSTLKVRDNGVVDIKFNYADLKGVGLVSGNEYVLQRTTHVSTLDPAGQALDQTVVDRIRMISRGSDDNFFITIQGTIHVPPVGVPVVDIVVLNECRG
jgi:hypothetical protein